MNENKKATNEQNKNDVAKKPQQKPLFRRNTNVSNKNKPSAFMTPINPSDYDAITPQEAMAILEMEERGYANRVQPATQNTQNTQKPVARPAQPQQQRPKPLRNNAQNNSNNSHKPQQLQQTHKPQQIVDNRQKQSVLSSKPTKKQPSLNIIPLGGLGEVGKNITVYECQNDMIVVDCGLIFPDNDMLGVDLVIPDFTFVLENKDKIKGIIITHGHEDHIGALPYLLKQVNLPVYGTRLTIGLIKNKLKEHNLLASANLNEIKENRRFKLGCMKIDPIAVNHSIPDAVGFAIDTPAGIVIHTGDFKIDYTPISGKPIDLARFSEYGQRGVLALLSDSTNSERPGSSMSEKKVGESFETLFNLVEKKRIIIATFASNIQRVQQILNLAAKHGRKVAVSGRSMINNTEMALELGYLDVPKELIIDIDLVNKYPPEQIVIVTTGSQGETLSALSRMSMGTHRNVKIDQGDCIIVSANPIPGNEKTVGKVINSLLRLGAEVIYESMYDVHTSGHACNDEQKIIMNLTKPQYFLPVHGEYKQLKKHANLATSMGIAPENIHIGDNGEVITLSKDKIAVTGTVTAGQVFVDGLGVGDVGSVVLRDRRLLSQDGLIIVVATVDSASGEVLSGPDIVSRGFVYVRESEDMMEAARMQVREVFDQCEQEGIRDWATVKNRIRDRVSQYMYRRLKRSPVILPILMEI